MSRQLKKRVRKGTIEDSPKNIPEDIVPLSFRITDLHPRVLMMVLTFIPHSIVLQIQCCNRQFRDLIKNHFEFFKGYRLTLNCGRRASFVKSPRGSLLHTNKKKHKSPRSGPREVVINDNTRTISFTTNNRPLRSDRVRKALHFVSKTHISELYIRRLIVNEIPTNVMSPRERNILSINISKTKGLPKMSLNKTTSSPLLEMKDEEDEDSSTDPEESADRFDTAFRFDHNSISAMSSKSNNHVTTLGVPRAKSLDDHSQNQNHTKRSPPGGGLSAMPILPALLETHSVSHTGDTIQSPRHLTGSNDEDFVIIIQRLVQSPIESLIIGEECGIWTWSVLVYVLRSLNKIKHLKIAIGGFAESLPPIERRKDWYDFVKTFSKFIPQLDTLWVYDDALLRVMLQLSSNRQYKLSKKQPLMDRLNETETLTPRTWQQRQLALTYVRYQCQFSPLTTVTGIEFDGITVLEIVPWDGMFLNVPKSIRSLRLCRASSFTEVEDWTLILPYVNQLEEMCLYQIKDIANMRGLSTLRNLRYLCIKQRPKSINLLLETVYTLCHRSPLQYVSLIFKADRNDKKSK